MRSGNPVTEILMGVAAITAVGLIGGTLARQAEPMVVVEGAGLTPLQQEQLDKSATASLFGQFRSSVADFLWLKVDKYLHNGVELRGLTEYEKKQRTASTVHTSASDVANGYKQHTDETTEIPEEKKDWRGRLGDLEREVQPYRDMSNHTHRDPKEALPLFRLMTAANPNFVAGYVYGAAMIARDHTKIDEAIAFLQEGADINPNSIEIQSELGEFYASKKGDYAKAVTYADKAIALGAGRDPKSLTEDELDSWQYGYRWKVLSYRYLGNREEAHAAAVEGLKHFPSDVTCRRQLEIERTGEWRKYITPDQDTPKK